MKNSSLEIQSINMIFSVKPSLFTCTYTHRDVVNNVHQMLKVVRRGGDGACFNVLKMSNTSSFQIIKPLFYFNNCIFLRSRISFCSRFPKKLDSQR